jgi:gamma-glutamyl:cysteine ligase YbdK (ATP-grasp superfamily)
MGTQRIDQRSDPETLRVFTDRLLTDLDRLESLLDSDDIESGPSRIGAELEMFVVDRQLQPSKLGPRILDSIHDPRITPELGAFNLEANTPPVELGGTCLSDLEHQLLELLGIVRSAAADHDSHIVLTGILPTLEARHATLEFMTPAERYHP